ncbi:LOW QUALITY PROTEIN: serine/threonine-protein phosphatase 2A regulatory subunit B'' subunit alpha [Drosophila rhopaloa]|uniref:Serine/threonine-protein phosphatase 2A regulatory subunit B'' subunit alpha n=1 Tax=Drosophila rhopaloa TaxID=1041015 RepID=A0A6P4FTB4_DRORH|nr:LOW QUALITY PROTEIN: serine/threonine-protein phosphatase 2A regulatory subunit B'' subunit alpha [Drosophila rhopaloa]
MQANSSTTTTTTTTKTKKLSSGTGSNMISSVAVTSAIKTTTTTRNPAGSGASPKSPKSQGSSTSAATSDPNAEIAELTKKINEHADAIYETWKSHGIPPPEIMQMYTNAAASGDLSPTADNEGLQKMVTSFVNKDKEQRGKTNSLKKSDITSNGKVKKVVGSSFNPVPDQVLQSPKKVAAVSKPLPDVNLNYDISLDLDVNNLSTQQTHNLLKISELIQQQKEAQAPATVGKKRQNSKANANSNSSISANSAIGNKLTASEQPTKKQSKASSRNGSLAVSLDVVDGPSARMGNSMAAVSDKGGEPAATNRKSSKTKENSADTKPATKEKPTGVATVATARKSTSRIATDNASNIAAAAAATAASAAATATSMDATPATSASTTMPTLNKVKPTSGARAALTNGQDKMNLLTRGSVAERVLMFEKCPDVRHAFLNIKRPQADTPPKSLIKVKLHATPPPPPEQNLLQKEIRSTKSVYIPRFYFPHGKPQPNIAMERVVRGILSAFDSFPNNQVTKDELPRILKICGLPFYWRMPVMVFCQSASSGLVERQRFVEFWKQMNVYCHEAASRFVYILSRGQRFRSYIVPEDLVPMVQDVVDTHPGLAFLKEATEFHSRYVHTVIARIFYSVNRSWSGKITIAELKRSDLLEMISLLEEEEDINQIMAFFSYEHFYVIYCKFWELDKDHDLLVNQEDLAKHSDHALSSRIVERIFSGCVTRSDNKKAPEDEAKMSYTDFVWFILSEEDKRTPTAIEYWFRCMDVDGDGVLSMYELEYFYEEQQQRMEGIGIECLPFEDCLCQMLDMIKPANRDCITLGDLKRCKMTHVFFDTFFNLEKYLDHEQRDPFASQRDEYTSDWDRFAAQEYELLISEEND